MMKSTSNIKSVKRKIDIDGEMNNGKKHAAEDTVALTFSVTEKVDENQD